VLKKCKSGMNVAKKKCEEFVEKIDPTKYIIKGGAKVINWGKGVGRTFLNLFGKRRRRAIGYLRNNYPVSEIEGMLVFRSNKSR